MWDSLRNFIEYLCLFLLSGIFFIVTETAYLSMKIPVYANYASNLLFQIKQTLYFVANKRFKLKPIWSDENKITNCLENLNLLYRWKALSNLYTQIRVTNIKLANRWLKKDLSFVFFRWAFSFSQIIRYNSEFILDLLLDVICTSWERQPICRSFIKCVLGLSH